MEDKDIDITPEEMGRIHKALQDDKFKEMFFEYCKEISDPENRAKYEEEICQLEKERGFDVTFVKPEPGHVIKVIDQNTNKKLFINICTNKNVGQAAKTDSKGAVEGENWTVPHIINKPRDDADKAGNSCVTCDVIFHPEMYSRARKHQNVMRMLNSISVDAVEKKLGFKIDKNNIKYPKLRYKGRPEASIIRNKNPTDTKDATSGLSEFMKNPDIDALNAKAEIKENQTKMLNGVGKETTTQENDTRTTPQYRIKHRGHFDLQEYTLARNSAVTTRPAELCVEIELPMARSAVGIDLDVFEKRLILDSKKPNYYLDLPLPYPVDEDKGTAKFDKSKKILFVILPVLPKKTSDSFSSKMESDEQRNSDNQESLTDNDSREEVNSLLVHKQEEISKDAESFQDAEYDRNKVAHDLLIGKSEKIVNNIPTRDNSFDCEQINSGKCFGGEGEQYIPVSSENLEQKDVLVEDRITGAYSQADGRDFSITEDERLHSEIVERSSNRIPDSGEEFANEYRDNRELQEDYQEFYSTGMSLNISEKNRSESSTVNESMVDQHPTITASIGDSKNNQNMPAEDLKHNPINLANTVIHEETPDLRGERIKSSEVFEEMLTTDDEVVKPAIINEIHEDEDDIVDGFDSLNIDFEHVEAGIYKLPPYNYDQDGETINVKIQISNVRMENVSLGFSNRKVYFSAVTELADSEMEKWCLVIKFLDYCHLDSDLCSIDVEEDSVVLLLQKSEDSFGLWNKFYAGSSEKEMQELFFMTDHSMAELLDRSRNEDQWVQMDRKSKVSALKNAEKQSDDECKVLEHKLERLLREQEYAHVGIEVPSMPQGTTSTDADHFPKKETSIENSKQIQRMRNGSDKSRTDSEGFRSSTSSDINVGISLDDLPDDVIYDTVCPDGSTSLSRAPVERSQSDEFPSLRSILKRSTSDMVDDSGDFLNAPTARIRSQSFNVDTRPSDASSYAGRQRNKSVSFDPEPKVCEFMEYSKKQLKKMRKQERKQIEIAAKKSEASAKKSQRKNRSRKNDNKSGKNKNFLNGLRKDRNSTPNSSFDEEDGNDCVVDESKAAAKASSSSVSSTSYSSKDSSYQNSKEKLREKNISEKPEGNYDSSESKDNGNTPTIQLSNSLIYELDS